MALDRNWEKVPPQNFILSGGADGSVAISDNSGFKLKQKIKISSDSQPSIVLEVQKVVSSTLLYVGYRDSNKNVDLSLYTVLDGATISAEEQVKSQIPKDDQYQHTYETAPIVARRVVQVDGHGSFFTKTNPMPVQLTDGSIEIGTVNAELEVQLSRRDNFPDVGDVADSIRIGNQDSELTFTKNDSEEKQAADVVALNKLIDIPHDEIEITQFTADGDPEIIAIRENGQLKRTLTLTYNTDGDMQKVVRS